MTVAKDEMAKFALVDCLTIKPSPPEKFLGKRVPKICTKFTGEHPCRSAISIQL